MIQGECRHTICSGGSQACKYNNRVALKPANGGSQACKYSHGLWIPTKAKTPEQSLYGGLYLEMKNSAHPRVRKSAEKGRFELIG